MTDIPGFEVVPAGEGIVYVTLRLNGKRYYTIQPDWAGYSPEIRHSLHAGAAEYLRDVALHAPERVKEYDPARLEVR